MTVHYEGKSSAPGMTACGISIDPTDQFFETDLDWTAVDCADCLRPEQSIQERDHRELITRLNAAEATIHQLQTQARLSDIVIKGYEREVLGLQDHIANLEAREA